jgi:ATP-dependent helicase HrpB
MTRSLPALPVTEALPALRHALADAGRAVLAAPPGSGKTTLVPLALLDEPWLRGQKIVMLEPRRVAARAAAARMAWLLGEKVGATVGFQIRFEKNISAATRIEVITEGLLTRRLQADPELPGVGLVIFDEFHERSLDADLALALTLDARANLNPDLRVLVMSATLDTQRVAALLGENNAVIPATGEPQRGERHATDGATGLPGEAGTRSRAGPGSRDRDVIKPAPVVQSGGKLFPVEVRHLPPRPQAEHGETVAQGALTALQQTAGDLLCFLPGAREIRSAQRSLESRLAGAVSVHPLYGDLSSEAQDAALTPARDGRRKIILATNIAQTSLTVEGVTTVVDGGLVRVARFDLGAGANELVTQRVSRASAEQRAGRAGRLGPGIAYRLWSPDTALPAHDTPDLLATDLSRFALELAVWGVRDPRTLHLLDPPPEASWSYALGLLRELGALDDAGRITAHGRALARLPAPPRRAHLLLLARQQGLAPLAAWVAALLDERDSGGADLAQRVEDALGGRAADPNSLRRMRETVRQMLRLVDANGDPAFSEDAVARIVSWGYPERIARRREGPAQKEIAYLCEDGGEARVSERDVLAQSEWLAIAHWDPGPPRRIRQAVRLRAEDALKDHADRIRTLREVRWDAQRECVVAESQERLGAIVLGRKPLRDPAEDGVRAMLAGIRQMGLHALPWTDSAREWQARVLSLRAWRPEEDWPDVSDAALLATLEDWLAPHLGGITRRDHLGRLDLQDILAARFDYAQQQALARLAPTHIEVPTGSRIRLEYRPPEAPALHVKLQEMFGCRDTPTVAGGRMRVVLHLLSPAQRPIAVTQDLGGFWSGGYADVKKDMKGRYPRHPWPENPLEAAPTRRAKPRNT